jgi:hypothetical protein
MVLYGSLTNAKPAAVGDAFEGTTDLVIETVVKDHEWLGKRKVITLDRYVPPPVEGKWKYLVFCDIFKGKVDPYRGLAVKEGSDLPRYLKGALEVRDAKPATRLAFFFDFLDNADLEVSTDAFLEFARADYKDLRPYYEGLRQNKKQVARIAGWLRDPRLFGARVGSYALMLGHCGGAEDAALLRGLLEDPDHRLITGIDGVLAGYILLEPKEGWKYLLSVLENPRTEFNYRWSALRTARFFLDNRLDVVSKKDGLDAVTLLIEDKDMGDMAIEELRKRGCVELMDRILGLQDRPVFKVAIVRRAVLRFALEFQGKNAQAAAYVKAQREKDPDGVREAEELLQLEKQVPAPGGK